MYTRILRKMIFFNAFLNNNKNHVKKMHFTNAKRELSNEYVLANIGFDTAENEPSKLWPAEDTGILPVCRRILGFWDTTFPPRT